MGAALITETMENRPEIGFTSYDRFFPNQDTMPLGGFGNLIALPLQRKSPRKRATVFLSMTTCDLTMTSGPTYRLWPGVSGGHSIQDRRRSRTVRADLGRPDAGR